MRSVIWVLAFFLVGTPAHALKFKKVNTLKALKAVSGKMSAFCAFSSEAKCFVNLYKIIKTEASETWPDTVKMISLSDENVHEVSADSIDTGTNEADDAITIIVSYAGLDLSDLSAHAAIENLRKQVRDSFANKNVSAVAGYLLGDDHYNQRYLAIIDSKAGEAAILRGGQTF